MAPLVDGVKHSTFGHSALLTFPVTAVYLFVLAYSYNIMFTCCFGKLSFNSRCKDARLGTGTLDGTLGPPCQQGSAEGCAQQQGEATASTIIASPNRPAAERHQGASLRAAAVNAVRIQDMQPENVSFCNPHNVLDAVQLLPHELGKGTYGIVVTGSYRGLPCAIKVMLSRGDLDRAALREVLLGPSLVHPHLVSTFLSRCAPLTDEFFNYLEGPGRDQQDRHADAGPRALEPLALNSGDGFGEPGGVDCKIDPLTVLHQLLFTLQARTGHAVVVTVLQYCDKGTMDSAIRKGVFQDGGHGRWPLRVAVRALLRTAGEMARGLLHLHDSNVIHGDLKPANVLLHSSDGDIRGFTVKVADFGLSHVLPASANSMFTDTWGSVAYMAPEAFDGKVSRATDVWAFGVCLWEMLTGKRPYSGLMIAEVVKGVKEGSLLLKWPSDGSPLSRGLEALGQICLSHSPDARPDFKLVLEQLIAIEQDIRTQALAVEAGTAALAAGMRGDAPLLLDTLLLEGLDVSGAPPAAIVSAPPQAAAAGAPGTAAWAPQAAAAAIGAVVAPHAAQKYSTLPLGDGGNSGGYL